MKYLILISIFSSVIFQSCCFYCYDDDDLDFENYSDYDPIILERSIFENSIVLTESKSITNSGKIYVKDSFLFINEVNKGFHIYDNSDPANPTPLHFLAVPGATDLAIRNNTIYINQATDLIAISFNATDNSVAVQKRIENTFPILSSPDGWSEFVAEDQVIVNWKLK